MFLMLKMLMTMMMMMNEKGLMKGVLEGVLMMKISCLILSSVILTSVRSLSLMKSMML